MSFRQHAPIYFIGDVHSRPELVRAALEMADGNPIVFLGDIFDGPGGASGSVACLRLVMNAPNAELILGNHEAYPIFSGYGDDGSNLALFWGLTPASPEARRVHREWLEIRDLLHRHELEWLMRRPLYIQGDGWIAAHAKAPNGPLPPKIWSDYPHVQRAQIEMLDNTDPLYPGHFWAQDYDGRHGFAIVGHTRLPKVGEFAWDNCILLDWDAKNVGTAAYAIWFDGEVVEVGGLDPLGRTSNPRKPLTPEQKAAKAAGKRKLRAAMLPEQRAERNKKAAEYKRRYLEKMTPEERAEFNKKAAVHNRRHREKMTPEERTLFLERSRANFRRWYASKSPEDKAKHLERVYLLRRERFSKMTLEEQAAYKKHKQERDQKSRDRIREKLERARLGVLAYFTKKEIEEMRDEERVRRQNLTEEEKAVERNAFRDMLNSIGFGPPNFEGFSSLRQEERRAIAAFLAGQKGTKYETMMEDEEVEEAEMLEEGDFDGSDDSREPNPGMSSETVSGVRQKLDDVIYIADSYLDRIGAGQIESVWLTGSRASGEEGPDSDWDFLIVGYGFDDVEAEKLDTLECGGRIYGIALDAPTHLRHDFKDIIFCDNEPAEGIKLWDNHRGHIDLSREHNPKRTAALRTDEVLWKKIVKRVTAGNKGGHPGQWSARKAQLAVKLYKEAGGGYIGPKSKSNALDKWTREDWRTKSGRPSLETGERYLPAKAIKALSAREYARTTEEKRKGLSRGKQFVPQPAEIAAKTAKYRRNNPDDYDFED